MPPDKTASDETTTELDPLVIYFTFSRIRSTFSCGRAISSTLEQFLCGELTARDLPLLCVLTDGRGHYFSQNNRRLYLYKELRRRGVLQTIPVRLRRVPNTRRMREKYTTEKCALRATFMRETFAARNGGSEAGSEESNDPLNNDKDNDHNTNNNDGVAQGDCVERATDGEVLKEEEKIVPPPPVDLSASRTACNRRKAKKKAADKQPVSKKTSNGPMQSLEDELAELGL